MSKFFKLEDIEIYREALLLAQKIYKLASNKAFYREFSLIDQLKRAALSIIANIAEGYGRRTKKDFCQFLSIALGSANEVIAYLDFVSLQFKIDVKQIRQEYLILAKRIYAFRIYLQGIASHNS